MTSSELIWESYWSSVGFWSLQWRHQSWSEKVVGPQLVFGTSNDVIRADLRKLLVLSWFLEPPNDVIRADLRKCWSSVGFWSLQWRHQSWPEEIVGPQLIFGASQWRHTLHLWFVLGIFVIVLNETKVKTL